MIELKGFTGLKLAQIEGGNGLESYLASVALRTKRNDRQTKSGG